MQVVESFIRDQTVFTAYQSYVETNFINDMQNMTNSIVESTVKESLKNVIFEVLKEIFIANEASVIL
jgi:hypothetical protein